MKNALSHKYRNCLRGDIELPANFVIPFFLYLIRSFILALSSLSPVSE